MVAVGLSPNGFCYALGDKIPLFRTNAVVHQECLPGLGGRRKLFQETSYRGKESAMQLLMSEENEHPIFYVTGRKK